MKPARRAEGIQPSGIRRYFELAEEVEDIISLGVGEPDFSPPWPVTDAAIASLEAGQTSYTTNRGLAELREAISRYVAEEFRLSYQPDDEILVTTGASEAVDLAIRALVDPGDVVAVAEPTYLSYRPLLQLAGAEVISVPTHQSDEFRLTAQGLTEAGATGADFLITCYPNNPTGAIMTEEDLKPIAAFAREHDLTVLSDEIYAALSYDIDHVSIGALEGMRERTVIFNGFSKAFAMTGLRLGYALAPAPIAETMNRIHQYSMLSAPTTAQHAALEGLQSCLDDVDEMRRQYDRRRRFVLARFEEMGVECFEAKGAFYVFPECPEPDEDAFVENLLETEQVAVVPGRVFGDAGRGHLRVSYATSLDQLREAMNRIERYLA